MGWEPNFEEVLSMANGLQPTFDQYAQQNDYGVAIRSRNVKLDVVEDEDDILNDVATLKADARAELELKAYRRKFGGASTTKEIKKWEDQEDDTDSIDSEISNMMRNSGLEREPLPNYRPSSKVTFKSAVSITKLPVAGAKNSYIDKTHFKFENPYVKTPASSKSSDSAEETKCEYGSKDVVTSSDEGSSTKTFNQLPLGVDGEQYVTPTQLYMMKARRNHGNVLSQI